MCGIYGWQLTGSISTARREALAKVLIDHAAARGRHSWGAYRAPAGPEGAHVWRGLGSAEPYAMKLARHPSIAGHTRYATHGEVSVQNAHPLKASGPGGAILLAHNGVIDSAGAHAIRHGYTHPVDSFAIAVTLARDLPMADLEGYGAAWWVQASAPDQIRLAKLTESGDLAMGVFSLPQAEGGDHVGCAWHSTDAGLRAAAAAAGLILIPYRVDVGAQYTAQGGQIWHEASAPSRAISARRWEIDPRTYGGTGWDRWSDGWTLADGDDLTDDDGLSDLDLDLLADDPASVASAADHLMAEGLPLGDAYDPREVIRNAYDLGWTPGD